MSVKTYKKIVNKQLTKHFKLSEIHCHGKGCCSTTKLDIKVVKFAEKMRNALGVPVTVESGYRCYQHNRAVGGANGSGHTYGMALDLTTAKVSRERLAVLAELIGVPRIGIYLTENKKRMVHIGTGTKCHWINTGGYKPTSHSFIPVAYKKPIGKVTPKSGKKQIAYMQACLYARGYDLKIDGDWGKKTQNAVNQYRKSKGWGNAEYLKTKGISELLK